MRTLVFAAAITLSGLFASPVLAESERRFGAGVALGEPTGFSFKHWLSDANAIDGGIGAAFDDSDALQLHGDYLWHRYEWLMPRNIRGALPVYFGLGARLKLDDEDDGKGKSEDKNRFGFRIPIGINYLPYARPYDIFGELVPVLDVAPEADLELNVAIGIRYYFR